MKKHRFIFVALFFVSGGALAGAPADRCAPNYSRYIRAVHRGSYAAGRARACTERSPSGTCPTLDDEAGAAALGRDSAESAFRKNCRILAGRATFEHFIENLKSWAFAKGANQACSERSPIGECPSLASQAETLKKNYDETNALARRETKIATVDGKKVEPFPDLERAPAVGSTSESIGYRFTVRGPDIGVVGQVKNCIDYHVCEVTSSSLAGDPPEYRFHTDVSLDATEFAYLMKKCGPTFVRYHTDVIDQTTGIPLKYAGDAKHPSDSEAALETPISNPVWNEKILWAVHTEIQKLLDQKFAMKAVTYFLSKLGFNTGGYVVSIDPAMDPGAGAVTDHDLKTIRLNATSAVESCEFVYTLRHEIEHVRQIAKDNRCKAIGKKSAFGEHVDRERSAYMNDVFNAKRLCPEADLQEKWIKDHTDLFFEDYARN